jgi:hypothetical protein
MMIWPKLMWKCNAFLNGPFDVIFPCLRLVLICVLNYFLFFNLKEEKLRGRPGYEHLNEPLHILIEADLPGSVVDIRLRQAQEIIEELLKPVVCISNLLLLIFFYFEIGHNFITVIISIICNMSCTFIFHCMFTCSLRHDIFGKFDQN